MRYTFNRISFGLSALICIVTSCSTTDTPQPDLVNVVAGTYRVTFIDTSPFGLGQATIVVNLRNFAEWILSSLRVTCPVILPFYDQSYKPS
jgi:hypothetical protein